MSTAIDTRTPKAWIGCLACYNEGRLVGEWFEAITADEVTPEDLHGDSTVAEAHDELWVMDHENIPVSGEMSPAEAAAWGRVFAEIDEYHRAAVFAWVQSGDYIAEGTGDLPSIPDFEERYCGQWSDFDEYARNLADESGLLDGIPEEIERYFDWDSWIRDLHFDYTECDDPEGGVFVFRIM